MHGFKIQEPLRYKHIFDTDTGDTGYDDVGELGEGGLVSMAWWGLRGWFEKIPQVSAITLPGQEHGLVEATGDFLIDPTSPEVTTYGIEGLFQLQLDNEDAGEIAISGIGSRSSGSALTTLTLRARGLSPEVMGWHKKYGNRRDLVLVVEQKCGAPMLFTSGSSCKEFGSEPGGMNGTTTRNRDGKPFFEMQFFYEDYPPYLLEPYPVHPIIPVVGP